MKTLIIDLDHTLINSDLLYESIFKIIKKNPIYIVLIPFWLLRGRSYLKHKMAENVRIDPSKLNYNQGVLDYMNKKINEGFDVYLVSASNEKFVKQIAEYIGRFKGYKGSTISHNLKGRRKAEYLNSKYAQGFIYVGDSKSDYAVWQYNSKAVPVGGRSFIKKVENKFEVEHSILSEKASSIQLFLKAIRVHQWAKNTLLFLPLLLSHKYSDISLLHSTIGAFFAFSFCASSVYVLNDLLDLDADRAHHRKKNRPFASGQLSLLIGMILVPNLLLLSAILALQVTIDFQVTLLIYYFLTLAYSLKLKSLVLWDVMILAILFTLRIFAGAAATGIEISEWFLGFSIFFFLGLAFVKRVAELVHLKTIGQKAAEGRGYQVTDFTALTSIGISSGMISVLVFVLYLNSENVLSLYANTKYLWLIGVCLIFWISRIWLLTLRNQMHDDPVVFALKDKVSYFLGLVVAIIFYISI